jgi:flagellar hook assembly protein FlgD
VEGFVKWDGLRENGSLAASGNYIFEVEAFSDRGQRASKKLLVALLMRN